QPAFSPDGQTITFASDRAGASTAFRVAADGTGGDSIVYRDPDGGGVFVAGWSRNGDMLIAVDNTRGAPGKLMLMPAGGGAAKILVDNSSQQVLTPRFSPE